MTIEKIIEIRMQNHALLHSSYASPLEVVQAFGAVQSQDYPAAKWAVGLRLPGSTDVKVERDFARGDILRTHVMRPTWHFVASADIRWLLELTAPRVRIALGHGDRLQGLSAKVIAKSNRVITDAFAAVNI
jgi:hypothetical protein